MFGPEVIVFIAGAVICMILRGDLNWWDDDPPPRKRKRRYDEED